MNCPPTLFSLVPHELLAVIASLVFLVALVGGVYLWVEKPSRDAEKLLRDGREV